MLFFRFISENLTLYINTEEQRTGNKNFDFTKISDKDAEFGRTDTVKEKGFYILPSELFKNVRKSAKTDANLNETLSIRPLCSQYIPTRISFDMIILL
jgi:type I restriction enzyme M protein